MGSNVNRVLITIFVMNANISDHSAKSFSFEMIIKMSPDKKGSKRNQNKILNFDITCYFIHLSLSAHTYYHGLVSC